MRTTGIIAEFNPFHKGHKYILDKAREITGCDCLIVIMSGNFTQRGDIAIADKFTRAHFAVLNGADLVIELPYAYATAPAHDFALGAVSILNTLKVDSLVFGSETGDISILKDISDKLQNESSEFSDKFKDLINEGETVASAKSKALNQNSDDLLTPNNTLAIEYLTALNTLKSKIIPYTIKREGSNYSDDSLPVDKSFISASALRKICEENQSLDSMIDAYKNYSSEIDSDIEMFKNAYLSTFPLFNNDMSFCLSLSLFNNYEYLNDFACFNEGLSNRAGSIVSDNLGSILGSYNEILALLKTRNITASRIKRSLNHLMTGYTKTNESIAREAALYSQIRYIRLLAANKCGTSYLKALKKENENLDIITKLADAKYKPSLSTNDQNPNSMLLYFDIHAAGLYSLICANKFGTTKYDEYRTSPVIIKD